MKQIIKLGIIAAATITVVAILYLKDQESRSKSVTSNQQTVEQLNELRKKAASGDAQAKYALSLFSESPVEADRMIEDAATLGYGPAVVTFVDGKLQKQPIKAAAMLQLAANNGYVPAIVALVRCVDSGQCGENSRLLGVKWALVHRRLVDQRKIQDSNFAEVEQKLLLGLSKSDIEVLRQDAIKIADSLVLSN